MNKKKGLLSIATSFLLVKIFPFVSAIDISQGPRDLIQIINDFFSPFFEILLNTNSNEFFFAKVLLLILLFVVIVFVLNKAKIFGDLTSHPAVIYTIAAVVSILAMRYLPDSDLITGILLPYSTLGIAITTFLPLMIFFFFLHNAEFQYFGRRAGWALYGIIFVALWMSKDVQLSDTSNWIYWGALGFVVLCFLFDKTIHVYFGTHEIGKFLGGVHEERIVHLQVEYDQIKNLNTEHAKKRREKIIKELKKLNAEIPA